MVGPATGKSETVRSKWSHGSTFACGVEKKGFLYRRNWMKKQIFFPLMEVISINWTIAVILSPITWLLDLGPWNRQKHLNPLRKLHKKRRVISAPPRAQREKKGGLPSVKLVRALKPLCGLPTFFREIAHSFHETTVDLFCCGFLVSVTISSWWFMVITPSAILLEYLN